MTILATIGLFCEDIREEKQGSHTLVGILSDNIVIPQKAPIIIPKLALYVRIRLALDEANEVIAVRVRMIDGTLRTVSTFGEDQIKQIKVEAEGSPFAGLISRTIFSPFPVAESGRVEAFVDQGDNSQMCGFINFRFEN